MQHFRFSDEYGDHRISTEEAMTLLHVTKRTIQNYYHANRRDAGRWAYLEAAACGRLIPTDWDLRIRGKHLYASTGFNVAHWELSQIAFTHSMKDNSIAGLKRDNASLQADLDALRAKHKKLLESTRPELADVVPLKKEA